MAMPSAAWMFIASSAWMSSIVVMPPAAVISMRGGGAQAAEPVEVGALHHAFLVDIGAEEAGAVRLQLRGSLLRR